MFLNILGQPLLKMSSDEEDVLLLAAATCVLLCDREPRRFWVRPSLVSQASFVFVLRPTSRYLREAILSSHSAVTEQSATCFFKLDVALILYYLEVSPPAPSVDLVINTLGLSAEQRLRDAVDPVLLGSQPAGSLCRPRDQHSRTVSGAKEVPLILYYLEVSPPAPSVDLVINTLGLSAEQRLRGAVDPVLLGSQPAGSLCRPRDQHSRTVSGAKEMLLILYYLEASPPARSVDLVINTLGLSAEQRMPLILYYLEASPPARSVDLVINTLGLSAEQRLRGAVDPVLLGSQPAGSLCRPRDQHSRTVSGAKGDKPVKKF
ncbi:hypothetical protein J6590_086670 [Homalodisca vitripennis]|nr:hypothetical protein J6590_078409 [Homalodisca vitripennis]KAG8324675.1 hypothetical protein J6590_086670 [Homalodisca vitripennis]